MTHAKALSFLLLIYLSVLVVFELFLGNAIKVFSLSSVSLLSFVLIRLKDEKIYLPVPSSFVFALFVFWSIILIFFSTDLGNSIGAVIKISSFFLLFISSYNIFRKDEKTQNFFIILLVLFGSFLFLKDLVMYGYNGSMVQGRYFTGTFYWYNQMAGFLLFLIPLIFGLLIYFKSLILKYIFSFLGILLLLGMLLTYSRGGWISIFVGLFIFILLNLKKITQNIKFISVVFLGTAMLSVLIFTRPNNNVSTRVKSVALETTQKTRTVSGNLRTTVWKNGIEMMISNPVFGVGPGAFGSSYYRFQKNPWLYAKNTHNYPLETGAETGVPGFIIFSILVLTISYPFLKKVKKIKNPLVIAVFSGLSASFAHSLLDVDWSYVSLFLIFWLLSSLLLSFEKNLKEMSLKFAGFNYLLFLFPLILLVTSSFLLKAEKSYENGINAYFKNKDINKAQRLLKNAIKYNPYDIKYYIYLGSIEKQLKDGQPKEVFTNALKINKYDSEVYYELGLLSYKNKNFKEAESLFKKALELGFFAEPKYHAAISDIYLVNKRIDLAKASLNQGIEKAFPLNESFRGFEYIYNYTGFKFKLADLYVRLINLELRDGNKKEAKELLLVLEKDLNPKHPSIPHFKKFLKE